MENQLDLSEIEIIGIAAAAALALGGLVVGLSRGQERSADPSLVEATGSNLSSSVERVRGKAPDVKQKLDRSVHSVADRAPASLGQLRETIRQRLPEVQDSTSSRIAGLRDRIASTAGYTNGGRVDTSKLAEYILPVANAARDRIAQAVDEGRKQAESVDSADVTHRFDELRNRATQALHDQREQLASTSRTVSEETSAKSHAIAQRTTSVAKETTMSIVWLGIASALVYFVLLSPERREQVKSAICGAYEQARLLFLDLQGYDPEY